MNANDTWEACSAPVSMPLSDLIREQLQAYMANCGEMLPSGGLYAVIMPHMERPLIELALEYTSGNQLKAAKILGINRNTLRKKIQELQIKPRDLSG